MSTPPEVIVADVFQRKHQRKKKDWDIVATTSLRWSHATRDGNYTVVAVEIMYRAESRIALGVSKRNPCDTFNEEVGVRLAAHRAIENAIAGRARFDTIPF